MRSRVTICAYYAVTRCLEIISKAPLRLPDELRSRHPPIAWREMAAAGSIYRHEYEDVAARRPQPVPESGHIAPAIEIGRRADFQIRDKALGDFLIVILVLALAARGLVMAHWGVLS